MKSRSLFLLLLLIGACTLSPLVSTPAWGRETAGQNISSPPAGDEEGDILIIDLVRKNRYSRTFFHHQGKSPFYLDFNVIDLSHQAKLIRPGASGFSVLFLDAEPSLFTRACGTYTPVQGTYRDTYLPIIQEIAEKYGMDPLLIYRVIEVESGFNPNACSSANAMGLMQLIPETANSLNVKDPYDPYENIQAGVRYLKMQLDRFGSIELALAAYNAGPGAVENYGGVPPFKETLNYVKIIMERYYQGLPTLYTQERN
jgi:hypothetical protein